MFEFCEKCGSIMYVSKENEENLQCRRCGYTLSLTKDLKKSYVLSKEITPQLEEEVKN